MKRIFALLAIMLPFCGFAQIRLIQSGYPASVIGTDSLKVTIAASSFPSLASSLGGIWDLSTITDSSVNLFAYRVNGLIGYQFADSAMFQAGSFLYPGNVQSNISATEINKYRIAIKRTEYNLSSLTLGAYDSLVIDSQLVAFSSAHTKIPFPCTFNTAWSSAYSSDVSIHLTFLMNGDTSAPGIIRTWTSEKDTVTGWGKMRIPDASGMPSDYINVLQVQTKITRIDSFFLNGVPFNGSLLSVLGVTQGQRDTTYEQNYYRIGEITPLAKVEFHDAAYTQPYKATTHVQRLSTVGVQNLAVSNSVKIYPNPVADIAVIELPAGDWSFDLIDVTGRNVSHGILSHYGSSYVAQFPHNVMPGSYFLRISGEGQVFTNLIEKR